MPKGISPLFFIFFYFVCFRKRFLLVPLKEREKRNTRLCLLSFLEFISVVDSPGMSILLDLSKRAFNLHADLHVI